MGLTWAAGWAVFGVLLGASSLVLTWLPWDAFFAVFDAPLPALALPGFVGGVLFSAVLGSAGRHRRFEDLSLPQFAAWGALGGLLLSSVPAAGAAIGLLTMNESGPGAVRLTLTIAGPLTLLSALSAAASLILARRAERRQRDAVNADVIERSGVREETPALPGASGWPADSPDEVRRESPPPQRSR